MCLGEKDSQKGGQEDHEGDQEEGRQEGDQEEGRQEEEDREEENSEENESLKRLPRVKAFVWCNNEIGALFLGGCPDNFCAVERSNAPSVTP